MLRKVSLRKRCLSWDCLDRLVTVNRRGFEGRETRFKSAQTRTNCSSKGNNVSGLQLQRGETRKIISERMEAARSYQSPLSQGRELEFYFRCNRKPLERLGVT